MWEVYDEYDDEVPYERFATVDDAGHFVEGSDDPLTWRIRYID